MGRERGRENKGEGKEKKFGKREDGRWKLSVREREVKCNGMGS